jgi:hypothetical protein
MTGTNLIELLKGMDSIPLNTLDSSDFKRRIDNKYIVNETQAFDFLKEVKDDYYVLTINGTRLFRYDNIYFDTAAKDLYLMHHNGRQNRCKLRIRRYLDAGNEFFEIKRRNNKKITEKLRYQTVSGNVFLAEDVAQNVLKETGFTIDELKEAITVSYERITIFSKSNDDKLTVDLRVRFLKDSESKELKGVALIEHKYIDKNNTTTASRYLRNYLKQNKSRVSKYCIGIALTSTIKKNRFNRTLNKLATIMKGTNGK